MLGEGVDLPGDVELGAHVVVHAGTEVGAGARLLDHCVVGKPLALGAHSRADPRAGRPDPRGRGRCGGLRARWCWPAPVSEPAAWWGTRRTCASAPEIGAESVVGRGSAVDNDVRIGARVRIQTNAYLTAHSRDRGRRVRRARRRSSPTIRRPGRRAPGEELLGVTLRRGCRIGGGAVLLPGVEVGEEAFVAAGAVVTRDVPARAVVMGVPASVVREVPEAELLG